MIEVESSCFLKNRASKSRDSSDAELVEIIADYGAPMKFSMERDCWMSHERFEVARMSQLMGCMVGLPEIVMKIINDPRSHRTIGTRFPNGRVHTIYMGSLMALSSEELVFAHILTKRTHKNLQEMQRKGELVSISVTLDRTSYEVMARVKGYYNSGKTYDGFMRIMEKSGFKEYLEHLGMKVHGVWTLEPIEVWNQSATLEAGTRIA